VGPAEEAARLSRTLGAGPGLAGTVALAIVVAVALAAVLVARSKSQPDEAVTLVSFPASDSKKKVVVWAVGDGPDGGPNAAAVARLITRDDPDRLLYLGDVYETGTAAEYDMRYEPIYGALAKRTAPTPGNHEWPNRTTGYRAYWGKVAPRGIRSYYTFTTAGWQLLSLNSETQHDAGSRQLEWLRSKTAGGGNCRIAFWHRPRYSAGTHHGDQTDVQPFWDALRHRAVLVLNGHEHDMQRLEPRQGITELVSGAGGHSLYPLNPFYPGLTFGDSTHYGALRMTLSPGLARYRFVSSSGQTLDSGTTRCKPA
jgi:hypothetical protein